MIKVSVVIAAYATPQDGLDRVISSLEAQTLPTDEFEAVFVDDGSPDDTLDRLRVLAETRPWMRVFTIPNSGWGSAPRNEGTRQARGEYTLYMDHDDSLYPDALRGLWEFAHANGSDLVSPKESKTNDAWWGLNYTWWPTAPASSTNLADVRDGYGIQSIVPMVPHKLYRRQLLVDHGIAFPEGERVLWEDQFFNIAVYRHAKVVSVQADHPTYLWHSSATNSSHTFDPSREDFWTMLEKLLDFTDETLSGRAFRNEREFMRAQQVRVRIVDRTARLLVSDAPEEEKVRAFDYARRLLLKHSTRSIERHLPQKHRVQAGFLRKNQPDLFAQHHQSDLARTAQLEATGIRWSGTTAKISLQFRWTSRDKKTPVFRTAGDRIFVEASEPVKKALRERDLDVTDDVRDMQVRVVARERSRFVSWELPVSVESVECREVAGVAELYGEATVTLDFARAQLGAALEPGVWDLRWSMIFGGMERIGAVAYDLPVKPAALAGVTATAYRNGKHALTIDSSGQLRTVAIDAHPRLGRIDKGDRLLVPLDQIAVVGATEQPAPLYAVPAPEDADHLSIDVGIDLGARLVADSGGARIEADATPLAAGQYRVYALRLDELRRTRYVLKVAADGVILSSPPPATPPAES
ncbi:glycosyltransferase family 2 protein [Cellulomonas sp. PhB150]|uniref:glycosyltransferase family 2 protein n=1 Tax=Cellulomonas sp. PhB150 TaxID=2485188 RepID=UPI000FA7AAB1|nr:glycosyltransferase family 2 protein [Cellulomonas sp. PhB150]ROS31208.1 glycosyl transferase family 2 [Cellulomonas sp. PhB150]